MRRKWLLRFAVGAWGLCLAMWVGSCFRTAGVSVSHNDAGGSSVVGVWLLDEHLEISYMHWRVKPFHTFQWIYDEAMEYPLPTFLGWAFRSETRSRPSMRTVELGIPMWFVTALAMVAMWWAWRRRAAAPPGAFPVETRAV